MVTSIVPLLCLWNNTSNREVNAFYILLHYLLKDLKLNKNNLEITGVYEVPKTSNGYLVILDLTAYVLQQFRENTIVETF